MSRLAIIIPSVKNAAALEGTLVSVLENRPQRCEVLVVHSHPYNDPYQLEGEVRFIRATRHASYVDCANLGFRESTADVVHVLATGCRVTEGWTDGVMRHFNDPRVAMVSPVMLNEREPFRAVAAGISYGVGGARRVTPRSVDEVQTAGVGPILAASLAAVFYNRLTLATVGCLSAEVGADRADVDLGLLLKHAGFTSLVDPRSRVYAVDQPLEQVGAFKQALRAERLFWRNASLVGWLKALAAHPAVVAADVAKHLPRPSILAAIAGHIVGCCQVSAYRKHHQRVDDLHNSAPVAAAPTMSVRIDRAHHGGDVRQPQTTRARAA